jgi:hypothetical protein
VNRVIEKEFAEFSQSIDMQDLVMRKGVMIKTRGFPREEFLLLSLLRLLLLPLFLHFRTQFHDTVYSRLTPQNVCSTPPHGPHIPVSRGFSKEYEEMGGLLPRFFHQMSTS